MRTRGPRLGEILEQRGRVSREQLLRALRNQKVVGGRLGTCLLEIDAVTEDDLLKALAEQQGVPAATPDDLRNIPAEVIRLVPAKVARRLLAVPFRASGSSAHVAVFEARDLGALDELAFVSGRRVRVCVATEARLVEALEKYYGEECPPRFAKLLDRLNRARFLWAGDAPRQAEASREMLQWDPKLGVAPARPAERAEADSQGLAMFEPGSAPELPEIALPAAAPAPVVANAAVAEAAPERAAEVPTSPAPPVPAPPSIPAPVPAPAPAPAPPAEPAPTPPATLAIEPPGPTPPAPVAPPVARPAAPPPTAPPSAPRPEAGPPAITLETAELRMLSPVDRDDVARALLEFGASHCRRTLLFRIHRQEVAGWMAAGAGVDVAAIEAYRGPLERASVFFSLHSGAPLARGVLPDLPAHAAIRAALSGPPATDALALPVVVKDRLVAVLYLEPRGAAFEAAELADLRHLTAKAAIAFELCIMRAKLKRA